MGRNLRKPVPDQNASDDHGHYVVYNTTVVVLKELSVQLEDIRNKDSSVGNRKILSDKTNNSTMSAVNRGKIGSLETCVKRCGKSTPLSCKNKTGLIVEVTDQNISNSPPLEEKQLTVKKRKSICKKPLLQVNSSGGNVEDHCPNLSNLSNKCVYTKVKRETIRNKNMAVEEKLAQYEFEVDENEPVLKKRKKKNVKRKRKVKWHDVEYHPSGKVAVKTTQLLASKSHVQKVEVPKKVFVEQKLNSDDLNKTTDNCNESSLNCENISVLERSLPMPEINRKETDDFMGNMSPVSRPRSLRSSGNRVLRDIGGNVSEMENSQCENTSQRNTTIFEKSPDRLSCFQKVMGTPVAVESETKKGRAVENVPLNESYQFTSPANDTLHSMNTVNTRTSSSNKMCQTSVSSKDCVSPSSPQFSSAIKCYKPVHNTSHTSVHNSPICLPLLVNGKMVFPPRMSGGVDSHYNKEVAEKWSAENCFGFEDECEDTEKVSPLRNISLRQRLRRKLPFSSTPVSSVGTKLDRLSNLFKRKRESTDDKLCSKSTKQTEAEETNTKESFQTEKMTSSNNSLNSPFSNPLKQSKLDFTSVVPTTLETGETVCEKQDSPLLFKDTDDKTPTHFKEPARRSYVRTSRRKLKALGDEWIDVDSDAELEEHEHKTVHKKGKRDKLSKQEEKEANKWMKEFNMQCEEVEEFPLCVE